STRNSRIERLWVEVGTQFARRWRAFFTRLERLHRLNVEKPEHLWLLSTLFLGAINEDCDDFRHEWNSHPIGGPETNNKSPQDLRLLGQAVLGLYKEDCEGIHPDTINRYYGAHGEEIIRRRDQTGAGHPGDETDNESDSDSGGEEISAQVEQDQRSHVLHDAVEVPVLGNPFGSEHDEGLFFQVLEGLVAQGITPVGYKLLPEEQDADDQTMVEVLQVGRKRANVLKISLIDPIWHHRAKLWAQALSTLTLFEADGYFEK
ncbi:hypothetical protein BJ138DRAFT_1016435, partial [Hygrophoropsis aurantiaca]